MFSLRSALAAVVLAGGMALATGCASYYGAPVVPPTGFAYNQTTQPTDITFEQNAIGSRQGVAESMSILGLVSMGDASIGAAARQGNLSEVSHVDSEFFNILGVYSRYTTWAYGQ